MRGLIVILIVIAAGIGAYFVFEESDDGPLEDAAEEVDDAADEFD